MAITWYSSAASILNTTSAGWSNYTVRQIIDGAQLLVRGEYIRVTFTAPAGNNVTINSAYLGERAGTYGFVGTPLPITVSGSSVFTIPAGTTLTSDAIPFDSTGISALVISYYSLYTGTYAARNSEPGWGIWYKGGGNDAATPNASGYGGWSVNAIAVSLVEVGTEDEPTDSPVRITQTPVLVVDNSSKLTRVTQAPVLVLDSSPKKTRVTQVPVLILSVPTYPVRITQAPINVPIIPKPLPVPEVLVPDVPLTETLEWNTSLAKTLSGYEQRNLVRDIPRVNMNISIVTSNNEERRNLYYLLQKYLKKKVIYPLFQYHQRTSESLQGSYRLDFNTKYLNIFPGEKIAIYKPYSNEVVFVEITNVDANGVDLTEPLPSNILSGCYVSPTSIFNFDAQAPLVMNSVHGSLGINLLSTRKALVSSQNDATLETFNSRPILPFRPKPGAVENLSYRARFVDNSIGGIKTYTDMKFLGMDGARSFTINRLEHMNKLRKFAQAVQGSLKPFYAPTYFSDITLLQVPTPGSTILRASEYSYSELWKGNAWKALRIETRAGVKFRQVNDIKLVYDVGGNAIGIDLQLNSSLGNTQQDNDVLKISYMPLCRISDDRIVLVHNELDTDVQINISVVDG